MLNLSKYRFHLCWLIPLLIFDAVFFAWLWERLSSRNPLPESVPVAVKNIRTRFSYPTDRELDRFNAQDFQPTASGRPESAFYGSVRTEQIGKKIYASFHEGIDIAPVERDRAGNPRDLVLAAAEGEVAYLNRSAGKSNYGKYIVLLHGPDAGRFYTLYAHLAEINPLIARGLAVEEGCILGKMGSTANTGIPPANAHLHFETGLVLNSRFDQWFKRRKLVPDHGVYNGWNLFGMDPLAVFEKQAEDERDEYDLYAHLAAIPRAFQLVLKTPRQLDFFRRYPALWKGAGFQGGIMLLECSENGLPLCGRCADSGEAAELELKTHLVRHVAPDALGRNGCRIVVCENGKWRLGAEGTKWLAMLMF